MDNFNCVSCGEDTCNLDFEFIDDELNHSHPLCTDCSAAARLKEQTCEHCGDPATHEVELGFLCDDHHDDYADGYLRD